jgi:hypothetical protein
VRIQNRLPVQSSKLAKFGAARGQGAKGAESGGRDRQIRRPFHPDVQILHLIADPPNSLYLRLPSLSLVYEPSMANCDVPLPERESVVQNPGTGSNCIARAYDTCSGTENVSSRENGIIGFSRRCLICMLRILESRVPSLPLHDYALTPSTSNTSSGLQPFSSRLPLTALAPASLPLEITNAERLSSARPS